MKADFTALSDALHEVGFPITPDTDIFSLLQLAGVLLGTSHDVGRQLGQAIGDVPVELITVGRALSLLTGITQTLDPDVDVLSIAARYA